MKQFVFIFVALFAFGYSGIHLEKSNFFFPGKDTWLIAKHSELRLVEEDSGSPSELPPLALEFENDRADNPEAWNRHGIKLFNKGRYEEALMAYDQAISLKADDPEVWNNKGAALSRLGFYEEALAAYHAALVFRPNFPKAWSNKGVALAKLERYKESLSAYEQVIRLKPDDAEAWKNKTAALASLGRYFEALDSIKEALRIQPDFEEALELKEKLEDKIKEKKFKI